MKMPGLPMNQNSQQFENVDPRILEQMRQQSALDKMRQETAKQNDILKEKMDIEHNLANQQVQDMMYLQQKKAELEQQEAKKKADMEQFEQMKKFFEQQEMQNNLARQQMNNQNPVVPKVVPMAPNINSSPYANLRDSINPRILNQQPNVNTQQMFNQHLNANMEMDNLRRTQINSQFVQMKEQLKKMNVSDSSDKPKSSQNVKRRGINVDTSSSSSSKSEESNNSKTSSDDTIKSSVISDSINQPSKIKVVADKSLNSKNNASTFSKRRYKRNNLSVST
jgi:hypothetical protein